MSPASEPLATFLVSDFSCVRIGWVAAMSGTRTGSAMKGHPECLLMLCGPLMFGGAGDRRCTRVLDRCGAFLDTGGQRGQCGGSSKLAQGIDGQQGEVFALFPVGPSPFGQQSCPIRDRVVSGRHPHRVEDI